jgi:hypothetical protein
MISKNLYIGRKRDRDFEEFIYWEKKRCSILPQVSMRKSWVGGA